MEVEFLLRRCIVLASIPRAQEGKGGGEGRRIKVRQSTPSFNIRWYSRMVTDLFD